ncbi:hypothetical protein L596_009354 [Steinernema carpocapsae]|uniref:Uncharacterized protein n=1 Tax=Steinernema carpocapsae TaxID=34508 RepID=A0A4U5PF40_STECR|nr:hypothetical protein L596_009354 [Steinernema carpocapsae]
MAQTMTPQQQQEHQSNGFKQRPNYQNRYYNNSDRGENCDRNYANRGYQQRDLEDRRSSTGSYSNSRKNYY